MVSGVNLKALLFLYTVLVLSRVSEATTVCSFINNGDYVCRNGSGPMTNIPEKRSVKKFEIRDMTLGDSELKECTSAMISSELRDIKFENCTFDISKEEMFCSYFNELNNISNFEIISSSILNLPRRFFGNMSAHKVLFRDVAINREMEEIFGDSELHVINFNRVRFASVFRNFLKGGRATIVKVSNSTNFASTDFHSNFSVLHQLNLRKLEPQIYFLPSSNEFCRGLKKAVFKSAITSIDFLKNCANLNYLLIQGFKQEVLDCTNITGLHTTLEFLHLPNNSIKEIKTSYFDRFEKLKHLDLHRNDLRMIPKNFVMVFSKLSTLNLSGNPLDCQFNSWLLTANEQNRKNLSLPCKIVKGKAVAFDSGGGSSSDKPALPMVTLTSSASPSSTSAQSTASSTTIPSIRATNRSKLQSTYISDSPTPSSVQIIKFIWNATKQNILILTCQVSANPPADIYISYPDEQRFYFGNEEEQQTFTAVHKKRKFSLEDRGHYECFAYNALQEKVARVFVEYTRAKSQSTGLDLSRVLQISLIYVLSGGIFRRQLFLTMED